MWCGFVVKNTDYLETNINKYKNGHFVLFFRPTVSNFLGLKTVRRIFNPVQSAGLKMRRGSNIHICLKQTD